MPYSLNDPTRQNALDAARRDDPGALSDEVALLRLLIGEAVNEGQTAVAERLLSCLARVSAAHVAAQVRAGDLLERKVIVQICLAMCGLLSTALETHGICDDRQSEILDYVVERVEETVNEQCGKALLEGPRE